MEQVNKADNMTAVILSLTPQAEVQSGQITQLMQKMYNPRVSLEQGTSVSANVREQCVCVRGTVKILYLSVLGGL